MPVSSCPSPLFDHPQADVIIRSADNIDFRMFKLDLSQSSSVFGDMFSFPQPGKGDSDADLPVVPVTETSDVLELLLPFCICDASPVLWTLEDACKVVEPARKYDIKRALDAVIAACTKFAEKDPFKTYTFACLYAMESVARTAALLCLRQPFARLMNGSNGDKDADQALLGALDFRRLLNYREKCAKAAVQVVSTWVAYLPGGAEEVRAWCDCLRVISNEYSASRHPGLPEGCSVPLWWEAFLDKAKVKLDECTWEGVLQENEAMDQFFRWHSAPAVRGISCTHDYGAVMRRVRAFMPVLRSQVARSIRTVKLDFGEGTMPRIVRRFIRPSTLLPLLVVETLSIVGLIAYIALSKDSDSAAAAASAVEEVRPDFPPLGMTRKTFQAIFLPDLSVLKHQ